MLGFYVPVAIEVIEPEIFPDIALYLKSGKNFVLYKNHGRDFSKREAERLLGNGIDFLYVSPGDRDAVSEFMETNVGRIVKDENIPSRTKGKIMYQTSVNYVGDVFDAPEKVGDIERSKRLIDNLLHYLTSDDHALQSLETVMTHNYFTFVHSLQMTALSLLLNAEAYLLFHDELIDVGLGSLLHDFGKTFISPAILDKKGILTDSEHTILRRHPEEGYRFLKQKTSLNEISLSIVRYHHERNNGRGYPSGLKGHAIPRSAQVAAICDMYCNLTIDRTGRKALHSQFALQIMKEEMEGSFNERLLEVLEKIVSDREAPAPL